MLSPLYPARPCKMMSEHLSPTNKQPCSPPTKEPNDVPVVPQPYSAGTPQLSPLPLDNGALPHDDPFLVHGQPSSGLNALHQFNNNSNGTPYLGRPPFAYSAPVAHPYHRGYGDGPDQSPGLNAVVARLVAEVQRLSGSVDQQHITNNQLLASNQQLENSNQQLVKSNQQLTMRVEAIELLQAENIVFLGRLEGEFKALDGAYGCFPSPTTSRLNFEELACTCTGCWLRSSLSGSVTLSSSRVEVGLLKETLVGQSRSETLIVISMVTGPASFLPKVRDSSLKSSGTVSLMVWPTWLNTSRVRIRR
ncbi:hypothetical protein EV424DRAFT_1407178 [Suillus variegatus]|nr:hypothetical protein EV424DRAFT_1407178 [Suillus variegatus]